MEENIRHLSPPSQTISDKTQGLSEKAKIVMPLLGSVIALMVLFLLAWPRPASQGITKKPAHAAKVANRLTEDGQGAGWHPDPSPKKSSRDSRLGTQPTTEQTSNGENWWYKD
jgi:hypothetical protein